MQSVSDDDVRKRLVEKPRFELAATGVFRLGRWYNFWQGIPGLRASLFVFIQPDVLWTHLVRISMTVAVPATVH